MRPVTRPPGASSVCGQRKPVPGVCAKYGYKAEQLVADNSPGIVRKKEPVVLVQGTKTKKGWVLRTQFQNRNELHVCVVSIPGVKACMICIAALHMERIAQCSKLVKPYFLELSNNLVGPRRLVNLFTCKVKKNRPIWPFLQYPVIFAKMHVHLWKSRKICFLICWKRVQNLRSKQ